MRNTPAAAKTPKLHPGASESSTLVDHHCPNCGDASPAPLTKLAEGPLGFWCCPTCDQSFAVHVAMDPVNANSPPNRKTPPIVRETGAATEDRLSANNHLLALYGERLFLKSRLAELAEEVRQLESSHP